MHPVDPLGAEHVALKYPLQFEPGERWDYGIGIDWLGRVVEKVDGRIASIASARRRSSIR